MWCSSAVNRNFLSRFAAIRTPSSPIGTGLSRLGVRAAGFLLTFPLAAPLSSTISAGLSPLFVLRLFAANRQTKDILADGLWRNNVVFSQMLSLCPALAVLVASNMLVALLRGLIADEVRIPAFVLIIATLVTLVDLAMNAWLHELHKVLGLFIPLIVVNCLILGRAESFACKNSVALSALESFACKNSVALSALDGLAMGVGFTLALTLMGALREVAGSGTLFAGAAILLGPALGSPEMRVYPGGGALVMILPAGGFIVLGLMIAANRAMDARKPSIRSKLAPVEVVLPGAATS